MVYRGSVYNVSNVVVFTTRNEAVSADKQVTDLRGFDKKQFNQLLDQEQSVFVRQVFMLDDREVVYQAQDVDSWSDFNKMNKRFESAAKDFTKFLADKKKTQLKLK